MDRRKTMSDSVKSPAEKAAYYGQKTGLSGILCGRP